MVENLIVIHTITLMTSLQVVENRIVIHTFILITSLKVVENRIVIHTIIYDKLDLMPGIIQSQIYIT